MTDLVVLHVARNNREPNHVIGRGDPRLPPMVNTLIPYEGMVYLDVDTGEFWVYLGEWRVTSTASLGSETS